MSEEILFGEFCTQMDMGYFESTTVCRDVFSSCHGAVPADVYREDGLKWRASPRTLGMQRKGAVNLWWSFPSALIPDPLSWIDYVGSPRYCRVDHWHKRAWAVAVGGFWRMDTEMQRGLIHQEFTINSNFHFSFRVDYELYQGVYGDWVHALHLCPRGLPSYTR